MKLKALVFGVAAGLLLGSVAQAETVVRYSIWAKKGEAQHTAALAFEKKLEEVSGGKFQVEVFPGNQLGNPRDVMTQLALNTTQILASGDPGMKEVEYLALPFLMKDLSRYEKVIASDFGKAWMEKLANGRQMRLLGFMPRSPRHFSSNSAVNSVADMSGLNLRSPTRDYYVESLTALGAKPTPIPFKELYSALQTGLVEGQENPLETIYGAKFHEVQSHVALVGYIHKPAYVMISNGFWNGLSDEEKGWFAEAAAVQTAAANGEIDKNSAKLIETMKAAGVTFTEPDREEFKKVLWPVTEKLGRGVWGDDLFAKIVAIGQE